MVQEGTFASLMREDGIFRQLAQSQLQSDDAPGSATGLRTRTGNGAVHERGTQAERGFTRWLRRGSCPGACPGE